MKDNAVATISHVSNASQEIQFSIDQSALGQAHLMKVMSNLYSDPRKAVIREYSTNARDSHIFAGVADRPIEVRLPSERHLFFEVQDFGLGLNVDDLLATYSVYGRSDKRNSDEVNGTLGLGCKSAFTYAESLNVTAVKDGVKTLVTVVKNGDGVPVAKVLDTAGTTEPNGVTVSIPVRNGHVDSFAEDAAKFFSFWAPGTVLVNGKAPTFHRDNDDLVWVGRSTDDFGIDIAVLPGGSSHLVMGDVAYPFSHKVSGLGITAWVPMGAVNFTPSREALHYTDTTKTAVSAIENHVRQNLAAVVAPQIAALPPFERLAVVKKWKGFAPVVAGDFFREFGLTPYYGNITTYNPNRYSGRKINSSKVEWFSLLDASIPVVVGYPHRTITSLAKDRLGSFAPGASQFFLFPVEALDRANFDGVEGRGNIHTWDEIVAATPQCVKPKVQRDKVAFAYNVYHHGRFERMTEFPEDALVLWTYTNDTHFVSKYPTAYVVELRSNQIDKFLRTFPEALSASDYHQEQITAARAAITEEDRLYLSAVATTDIVTLAAGLRDVEVTPVIADDDLVLVLDALTWGYSEALENYERVLGYTHDIEEHPLPGEVLGRYPVLAAASHSTIRQNPEDFVLYINAKFNSVNNSEATL